MRFLVLFLAFSAAAHAGPVKILLSFDDGPDESTTPAVLRELDKRGAKAIFFVLTGPETILWDVFSKAETPGGFRVLKREIQDGHQVGCHWGGKYGSQQVLHPLRLREAAYDANGDGVVDKVTLRGNALESDLIQCKERVNQAFRSVPGNARTVSYLRPPLWIYQVGDLDARPTYAALGLQMILTDAKLNDGGYDFQDYRDTRGMAEAVARMLKAGQREVVVTLHDSNSNTASALPQTLDVLEEVLAGYGWIRGVHWEYTRSTGEVDAALQGYLKRARD